MEVKYYSKIEYRKFEYAINLVEAKFFDEAN